MSGVLRPEAVGCGHLLLMLQHAGDYGISPGLVVDFLRAFFHARWEGAFRVEYELLHGRHDERAVLNARVEGQVQPFSQIPLVAPTSTHGGTTDFYGRSGGYAGRAVRRP